MANTTWGKKLTDLRALIIYYVLFILIYVCLLYFTGPFLMTWGAKRSLFERVYAWFLTRPVYSEDGFWTILVDAIIWATAFYAVFILFRRVSFTKQVNKSHIK